MIRNLIARTTRLATRDSVHWHRINPARFAAFPGGFLLELDFASSNEGNVRDAVGSGAWLMLWTMKLLLLQRRTEFYSLT